MLAPGPAARTVVVMPDSPLPPLPPVRGWRTAALEARVDELEAKLHAALARIAELEAGELAERNAARKARRRERVRAAVEAEGR